MLARRKHAGPKRLASRMMVLCIVGFACGEDGAPPAGPLVDHARWQLVSEEDDPLASERPSDAFCDPTGATLELEEGEPSYGVDTGICSYLAAAQPALRSVRAGEPLHLRLYHFDLVADSPAEAHAAVLLNDQVAWEQRVPIPSGAALLETTFASPADLAAGEPVGFHLHNHGDNNWSLLELSVAQ